MLQLSVTCAVLAATCAIVALYELTNFWWALPAIAAVLGAISYVTGYAADVSESRPDRESCRDQKSSG